MVTNKSFRAPQLNMRRSKISPNKIANTGVNPYTGEYLSAGERKLLFQKRNVSSANVFKKSGALVKTTPSTITPDINVTVLSKRVFVLENDVSFLAKSLNKEAELEKKAQKQYEKDVGKVEEKKLRSGEEKKLEKKITKGLISPLKAVGKKAGGVLGTLMELFMTLLGGWLTNQGIEAIKADAEGNIGKLEEIKKNVIETLATVGGIFAILSGGLLVIGTIVKSLAKRIAKFLWRKTFGRILNPKPPTPTNKPTTTPGTTKPSPSSSPRSTPRPVKPVSPGGPKSPILGPNGKPVPPQVQGTSPARAPSIPRPGQGITPKVPPTPTPIKGSGLNLRGLVAGFAINWAIDQGLSKIDAMQVQGIVDKYNSSDPGQKKKILDQAIKNVEESKKQTQGIEGALDDFIALRIPDKNPFTGQQIPLIGGFSLNMESTRRKNLRMSISILDALRAQKQNPNQKVTPIPAVTTPVPAVTTPVSGEMPAAQIASPSSPSMSVPGPVSSAGNTTVIYKKVGGSGGQMQGQPLKSGSATDVPLIASADPSNFYTMYSQLLYNVVG